MGELIKVVSEEEEEEEAEGEAIEEAREEWPMVGGRAISRAPIVTLPAPITNCRSGALDGRSTTAFVVFQSFSIGLVHPTDYKWTWWVAFRFMIL